MEIQPVPSTELSQLEGEIRKRILLSLKRTTAVFISPKRYKQGEPKYDGIRFSKKQLDILGLILISWYGDYLGDFSSYVRYEIGEYLSKNLLFPELNASLVSSKIALAVTTYYLNYGPRKIFGTVLSTERLERILRELKLKWIRDQRPVPLVYRRGYKDKGSRRSETKSPSSDFILTGDQLAIEEKRLEYQETTSLIVRRFGDLVVRELIQKQNLEVQENEIQH